MAQIHSRIELLYFKNGFYLRLTRCSWKSLYHIFPPSLEAIGIVLSHPGFQNSTWNALALGTLSGSLSPESQSSGKFLVLLCENVLLIFFSLFLFPPFLSKTPISWQLDILDWYLVFLSLFFTLPSLYLFVLFYGISSNFIF